MQVIYVGRKGNFSTIFFLILNFLKILNFFPVSLVAEHAYFRARRRKLLFFYFFFTLPSFFFTLPGFFFSDSVTCSLVPNMPLV